MINNFYSHIVLYINLPNIENIKTLEIKEIVQNEIGKYMTGLGLIPLHPPPHTHTLLPSLPLHCFKHIPSDFSWMSVFWNAVKSY